MAHRVSNGAIAPHDGFETDLLGENEKPVTATGIYVHADQAHLYIQYAGASEPHWIRVPRKPSFARELIAALELAIEDMRRDHRAD